MRKIINFLSLFNLWETLKESVFAYLVLIALVIFTNSELTNGKPVMHNGQALVQALNYGHTGLVRFLSSMEISERRGSTFDKRRMSAQNQRRVILVSGGDGYVYFINYATLHKNRKNIFEKITVRWGFGCQLKGVVVAF